MPTQQITPPTPLRWFTFFHWLTAIASLIALAVFVIDYGFYLASSQRFTIQTSYGVLAGIFLAVSIVQLLFWREHARTYLKKNAFAYIMSLLMLLGFLGILLGRSLHYGAFANAYSLLLKFYLLTNLWHKFILLSQSIAQYNTSPARFIVISFSSAILIGTALLLTPKATIIPFSPLDALFTATSAICVTGLIVVDTATAFTRTGQLIILGLIQLGGLGIMTVTAFFSLIIGQRMTGREQVLVGNMLSTDRPAQLASILRAVFFTTISIEACGAVLLFFHWRNVFAPRQAWYAAMFHAVSAFCNAGFSIFTDSLMGFGSHAPISLIVCFLILLGGLGFRTLRDLKSLFSKGSFRQKIGRISVQSKVIITMTGILLSSGMVLFFVRR